MSGVAGPIDHAWGLGDVRKIAAAAAAAASGDSGGESIVVAVSRVNERGGENAMSQLGSSALVEVSRITMDLWKDMALPGQVQHVVPCLPHIAHHNACVASATQMLLQLLKSSYSRLNSPTAALMQLQHAIPCLATCQMNSSNCVGHATSSPTVLLQPPSLPQSLLLLQPLLL
jgi:hypothetical protein